MNGVKLSRRATVRIGRRAAGSADRLAVAVLRRAPALFNRAHDLTIDVRHAAACATHRGAGPVGCGVADEQYAYRPGRNARQAVREVEETLFDGRREVVDADLADYFGSIPHAQLLLSLARRIQDRRVPHLLKMWLK